MVCNAAEVVFGSRGGWGGVGGTASVNSEASLSMLSTVFQ